MQKSSFFFMLACRLWAQGSVQINTDQDLDQKAQKVMDLTDPDPEHWKHGLDTNICIFFIPYRKRKYNPHSSSATQQTLQCSYCVLRLLLRAPQLGIYRIWTQDHSYRIRKILILPLNTSNYKLNLIRYRITHLVSKATLSLYLWMLAEISLVSRPKQKAINC